MDVLLLHICLIKKMCEKWVNNAKFVTFNTIFSKIAHQFFFKILLSKHTGKQNKINLSKTLVADEW